MQQTPETNAQFCCRAASVHPDLEDSINGGEKVYYMFYFWGCTNAFVVYCALSHVWPAPETMVSKTITGDDEIIEAQSMDKLADSDIPDTKKEDGVAAEESKV
jgi:nucleobase:cation symporter-1, NCS1 family